MIVVNDQGQAVDEDGDVMDAGYDDDYRVASDPNDPSVRWGSAAYRDAYYASGGSYDRASTSYDESTGFGAFAKNVGDVFGSIFKTAAPVGAQVGTAYLQQQGARDQQGFLAKILGAQQPAPVQQTSAGIPGWAIAAGLGVLGVGLVVALKR